MLQLRQHLLGCSRCAQHVTQLRGGELPEVLRAHPAEDLLLYYVHDCIPEGPLGARLREEIAGHLQACEECRAQVAQVTLEVLQWTESQQKLAWVQHFVTGLGALAVQQQVLAQQAAARRAAVLRTQGRGVKRSGAGGELLAFVFDAAGKLVLDAAGQPCTVHFTVHEARIDPQRGLFLQLITRDEPYCYGEGRAYTIQVSLQHQGQSLSFPPTELRAGAANAPSPTGVATIRAKLGVEIAIQQLPVEALRLTVQRRGNTRGEGAL
jgi:hypothetical protein